MTLAVFGIIASAAGIIVGAFVLQNAALMVVSFLAFAAALGCLDPASDRDYAKHSDSINALNRLRVGYEDDDRRVA